MRLVTTLVPLTLWALLGCPSTPDPADDDDDSTSLADCEAIGEPNGAGGTFYESNPTYDDPLAGDDPWPSSTPADEGMDGARLDDAVAELEQLPYLTSFLVARHGKLVAERYLHGAEQHHSNNVHSASKSMLGLLTGIAIEQGHLDGVDQPIHELLPAHYATIDDPDKRDITVGHLLTMSAGFEWVEDASEYQIQTEPDWVQAILELPLATAPGSSFNYSTGQTHLLSAVLTEATGESLCAYAHAALFEPLGLLAEHWGRDPQGYFSGGCNVYLTPRELARFGQLVLDGGAADSQLVSEAWIDDAVAHHQPAGVGYHYGYLFWLTTIRSYPTAIAWGYGGQLVYVVRDLDLVVVITTDTRDFAPDYDGFDILADHVIPATQG